MTDMNEVAREIAATIVKVIYESLDVTESRLGEDVVAAVNDMIISELVGFAVFRELTAEPVRKMKSKERQAFTEANYQAIKLRMQECVSGGFEVATQNFSGITTQYYCQVKRVMPVANKDKLC